MTPEEAYAKRLRKAADRSWARSIRLMQKADAAAIVADDRTPRERVTDDGRLILRRYRVGRNRSYFRFPENRRPIWNGPPRKKRPQGTCEGRW